MVINNQLIRSDIQLQFINIRIGSESIVNSFAKI